MKGTVSLSEWGLLSQTTVARVLSDLRDPHTISTNMYSREISLIDNSGVTIFHTPIEAKFPSLTQKISLSPQSNSQMRFCIGHFRRHIEMDGKSIPAELRLHGAQRSFSFLGMEFWHVDFQSVIHFRCSESQFITGALLAHCLFNDIQNYDHAG